MKEKMVSTNNSDQDMSLKNENVFNAIIEGIKKSKLNFQLQQSPYSAFISLKKSFHKDRSGAMLEPSSLFTFEDDTLREKCDQMISQYKRLESDFKSLQLSYKSTLGELTNTNQKI